jgi:hypothetical protein
MLISSLQIEPAVNKASELMTDCVRVTVTTVRSMTAAGAPLMSSTPRTFSLQPQ